MFDYNNKIDIRPEEILIYLRKSRADDPMLTVEEVLSKHESRLDEWVARNLPSPIPESNRLRELVSGESISDRGEFQKLLKLVESPTIKAVLVVDVSRLGRPDTAEIGLISKIFRYTNICVITPERSFNVADDFEREMFENELKRGNYYLEAAKKQLSRGREISAGSGNYICSKPPYGYDKIAIVVNKRRCPTLAINEEQANIVRMIFNSFVNENIGTSTIANRLNDMHIKPPQSELWSNDSIRTILENEVYIGKIKWNKRKAILVVDNGEFRKTRPKTPEERVISSEGKHEAIISEELFYAAQAKRGRTHRTCDNKELRNPLAGLLYCECGRAMSYRHSTRGELKYRKDPRLVCNDQHHCRNGSCSIFEMTDFVVNLLKGKIAEYAEAVNSNANDSAKFHEKQVKVLEKKLVDIEAKELALWEAQLDIENKMPTHIFQSLADKLSKEREEAEAALAKARKAAAAPISNEAKLVTLQNALDALLDDSVSIAEKNRFLKMCIERITYHRAPIQKITGKGNGRGYISPPIELDVKMMF